MTSLVRRAKYKPNAVDPRLADLLSRKPVRVVTVAAPLLTFPDDAGLAEFDPKRSCEARLWGRVRLS
jgi:hypothetical protein